MQAHWLKAVGHAAGPLPAHWVEEGRTSVLREGIRAVDLQEGDGERMLSELSAAGVHLL